MNLFKEIAHRVVPSAGSEYPLNPIGRGIAVDHASQVIKHEFQAMLEDMIRAADIFDSRMNNAGFRFLGHLVTEERARVSLAFAAMVAEYAEAKGMILRANTGDEVER